MSEFVLLKLYSISTSVYELVIINFSIFLGTVNPFHTVLVIVS